MHAGECHGLWAGGIPNSHDEGPDSILSAPQTGLDSVSCDDKTSPASLWLNRKDAMVIWDKFFVIWKPIK